MSALNTGLSALRVNQQLLQLTGQNIANANTPGYHRQIAELTERFAGSQIGTGVELDRVTRSFNRALEDAGLRNASSTSHLSTLARGLGQIESTLAPGDGSIDDLLGRFFDDAEKLSIDPSDITQRRIVISTASALATQISATHAELQTLGNSLVSQGEEVVKQINSLGNDIARLNQQIRDVTATGGSANELQDRRANLLTQLSDLADIRAVPGELNQVNVFIGGWAVVMSDAPLPLAAKSDSAGQFVVTTQNGQVPLTLSGGKLLALQTLTNATLPSVQQQFNEFTQTLMAEVNAIQSTGVGLKGPATFRAGSQRVSSTTLPLSQTNLPMSPNSGDLSITVTNLTTGQRTLRQISYNPATQSLSDVAAAISTIPNLQAVTGAGGSNLTIMAGAGFAFDFTGNFSSAPDSQSITGSTTPSLAGTYSGTKNDTLTFRFLGTGTIGLSPNLTLEARDSSGKIVGSLNVGAGYEPGSELPAVLGVRVRLTPGTANANDAFSLNVVADPDTGSLLPSLGIQSFFVGSGPADLRLNPDLVDHPESLALSRTGSPADGTNLERLVALRDSRVLNQSSQSLPEFFRNTLSDIGMQTSDASARASASQALGQSLAQQIQDVSGVDTNEEMIKLVQYQRSFQFSAQFVSAVNQTLDELLRML
jgi:flagellar hook-associated protein 1 FlgK